MSIHPDMLAWFSKPEEAMSKKLHQKIDENFVTKK
jgi:hypothetical protein